MNLKKRIAHKQNVFMDSSSGRSDSDNNDDYLNIEAVNQAVKNPMEKSADKESTPCCGKHVQRLVRFAKRISKSNQFTKSSKSSMIKQRKEDQLLNTIIRIANEVYLQNCTQSTNESHFIGTSNTYLNIKRYNKNIMIAGYPFVQQIFRAKRHGQTQQCSSEFLVGSLNQLFNIHPDDQSYNEDSQFPTDLSLISVERTPKYDTLRVFKPKHGFTRKHNAEAFDKIIRRNEKQEADSRTDVQNACSNLTSQMERSAKDKQIEDIENLYCEDTSKRMNPVMNNASLVNRTTYENCMKVCKNKIEESNKNKDNKQRAKTNFTQDQTVPRKHENKDVKGLRQKMNCKVKGQTKQFTLQKPVYAITLQDKHLIESMSHDDTIRHAMHEYFNNDEKSHFSRPSVPIPSMHPLLPYKTRYLEEESDTTSDHYVDTRLVTRLDEDDEEDEEKENQRATYV